MNFDGVYEVISVTDRLGFHKTGHPHDSTIGKHVNIIRLERGRSAMLPFVGRDAYLQTSTVQALSVDNFEDGSVEVYFSTLNSIYLLRKVQD